MKAILSLSVLAALALVSTSARAQDPTPITVLAFTEGEGAEGFGMELYNAARTQVEFHRGYHLNDVPPQTLDEMLLAVGCTTLDRDCSVMLADIVGTSLLIWGEVVSDDDHFGVHMTMWDLERAREVRTRSHFVAAADRDALLRHHQVIGRSILYGDEGTLRVTASPPGANVSIVGLDSGPVPYEADGLTFGLYSVRVSSPGFEDVEEVVVVDLGGGELDVALSPVVVVRERAPREFDPAPVQFTMIGVGVAMVGAGVVFAVQKDQTQDEFDDVTAQRVLDRERAAELQDRGERQATMSNAFIAAGAAIAATGAVWRIATRGNDDRVPERPEPTEDPWSARFGGYAGPDGGGVSLDLTF